MIWLITTEYLWLPFSRFNTMNSYSVSKIYQPTIGSAPVHDRGSAYPWFSKIKGNK